MNMNGKLFIVSAPSGAGKTTVVNKVLSNLSFQCNIDRVITYTSKTPRFNEVHGQDYHFISKCEFEEKIRDNFFLEWSDAYENYYGTPSSIIDDLNKGRSLILILDRHGAQRILRHIPDAILIWLYTHDISVIENRLRLRKTEKEEQILKRLSLATQEIEEEYKNSLYPHKILNDELENAVQMMELVVKKELKIDVI